MSNTTVALMFVMLVNVLMFLTQVAIYDVNPGGSTLYNYNGSVMEDYGGVNQQLDSDSLDSYLPSPDSTIDEGTGNVFTDAIKSIKKFLLDIPGVKYLTIMVTAPYDILNGIFSEHKEMAFALGTFWWAITIFLIVSFVWGRE